MSPTSRHRTRSTTVLMAALMAALLLSHAAPRPGCAAESSAEARFGDEIEALAQRLWIGAGRRCASCSVKQHGDLAGTGQRLHGIATAVKRAPGQAAKVASLGRLGPCDPTILDAPVSNDQYFVGAPPLGKRKPAGKPLSVDFARPTDTVRISRVDQLHRTSPYSTTTRLELMITARRHFLPSDPSD